MDGWPLQLLVVTLADGVPPGGLLDQVRASRAAGVIHVVDGGIIHKGDDGELSQRPAGIELDPGPYAGKLISLLFGYGAANEATSWHGELARLAAGEPQLFGLSSDDLAEIADAIPRASDALVLLIEHRWTAGFAESVAVDRGVLLAQGPIVPRTVLELSAGSTPHYDSA
jgi:hypothetical protein